MTILSNVFALLIVLCLLVLLHEAGHFFAARAFGIRPYVFSFGIGWRVLGIQWRNGRWAVSFGPLRSYPSPDVDVGTDYRISLIPFGGYVMLQGESLSEEVTGDAREFRTRPRWQQLIVYVAGVALNIVLAWCLATALIWKQGVVFDTPTDPPAIQSVTAGSPAETAGLRAGDRLIEIEGKDARDPFTYYEDIVYAPGAVKTLLIERNGERKTVEITLGMDKKYHLGVSGFTIQDDPVIMSVDAGSPAEKAGLNRGDRIVRIEERLAPSAGEIQGIIKAKEGGPVRLEVDRDGKRLQFDVTPMKRDGVTPLIGIHFAPGAMRQVGLLGAAVEGVRYCKRTAALLFITIKKIAAGYISLRAMSGPIELAQVSGERWRQGPAAFIDLLALVSLQLGIINLLPIPGLDGGHMLILSVESVIRRALPERVKQWVVTSGFALLLLFAGIVIWLDVVKTQS